MADHRRREESTPLVPPRALGNQSGAQQGREQPSWRATVQTQEQRTGQQSSTQQGSSQQGSQQPERPTQQQPHQQPEQQPQPSPHTRSAEEEDTERTSPLAAAAAAVAAAKGRTLGASPRPEGEGRAQDQVRAASEARPGRTRRARLRLVRVDPWSVMKTAFLLSIAFGIMCIVAVFIIWSVLGAANVFDSINASIEKVLDENFTIQDYIGMDRVLSITMLVAVLDVVLLTAIATLGAFLYNLAASLLGGLEVTLAEDEY